MFCNQGMTSNRLFSRREIVMAWNMSAMDSNVLTSVKLSKEENVKVFQNFYMIRKILGKNY